MRWLLCSLRSDGFARILSPLLRDLKVFEETGISITKDDKEFVFKGSLAVVLADNLASHGIGGLMESFTAFRSCRFCMAPIRVLCDPLCYINLLVVVVVVWQTSQKCKPLLT